MLIVHLPFMGLNNFFTTATPPQTTALKFEGSFFGLLIIQPTYVSF